MQASQADLVRVIISISRRDYAATVEHLERYGLDIRRRMCEASAVSGYISRKRVANLEKIPGVLKVQRGDGSR